MGRLLAAAVALVLVLAGCGEASDPAADPPPPTATTSIAPAASPDDGAPTEPGSPIADGLLVPAGAELLGRVFPRHEDFGQAPDGFGELPGWTALLVVDGDVRRSFGERVRRAGTVGYAIDSEPPSPRGRAS